ncbi:MAG: HAMP domain-containing histidine kinase [Sulfurimonas sp.]|nr:HAMP domain-containing histidine kinase [Sulfurimonas sp.]
MHKVLINRLSSYSPIFIIFISTMAVVISSIPLVYTLTTLFGAEYTKVIFVMSIVTPFLMVPPTIAIIINLSKHLKYFQDELDKEIEKNKKKDIILHEQTRFALMGEMMANISHQWKQPLNTIGLAVVKARTSDKKDLDGCFDIVEDNVRHLSSTINDFISFFDKRTHSEVRDINDIVREIKSIIDMQMLSKNIDMKIDMDKSCPNILVSSSISQVVLNLLNNSKDAFSNENEDKKIVLKFICDKQNLQILCCDNGVGINKDVSQKIFNPYFTTKYKQQGVGIGLYMSKEIINKIFNGKLELVEKDEFIDEFKDMTTCFSISLPCSENCILKDN